MKTDLWDRAEEIFNAALSLPPAARGPFLQRECNGETGLLSEVESLLQSFESHSGFLEDPVFDLGLNALNNEPLEDRSGSTIGPYQLEERIGVGGMGEVYKAVDTRLNRRVAVKFLTNTLANNKDAKRQLMKEAQAVAMLDHPNICSVHSIEQMEDSQFIVMQFIEGQTLGESIGARDTTPAEFRSIARQILSGVAFAYSHGVIHRDLKPGNIMLTPDGTIKVLDFGLAKIIPQRSLLDNGATDDVSQFSQAGAIIGTVSYMSPEQLRGERLDYRSDVFSVGVVLYELLSGKNPFKQDSQAETIAAVLGSDPPPLDLSPDFSAGYSEIAKKCLAKKREDRFQSAAEILVELDNAENRTYRSPQRKFRLAASAVLAVIVLAVVLFAAFFFTASSPQRTLAVLPISLDPALAGKEYLADGLTQGLIDELGNLSGLKVKSEYLVSRFKKRPFNPKSAGEDLGVDAVFTGEIITRDDSLLLVTKLIKVSDGAVIDSDEHVLDESNLPDLQDKMATAIASKVSAGLSEEDKTKLAKQDTENPDAKLLYLNGRHFLENQAGSDDLLKAADYFKKATDQDRSYTKAWTGLADTYTLIGVPGHKMGQVTPEEAIARARYAAAMAADLDPLGAEPQVSLGMIKLRFDWDWEEAEKKFREAISRNPELPSAHLGLSNLLIIKQRFPESLEEARIAKQLVPFSPIPDLSLARTYSFARDWTEMDLVLSEALTSYPDHKRLIYFRGLLYLRTERFTEAIEIFETIYASDPVYAAAPLAWAYARVNRKSDASKILAALETTSKTKTVSSQEWAWIYLALGERSTAFEYLRRACEERFSAFPFALIDPAMDEVKDDPRLLELRKCANLDQAG